MGAAAPGMCSCGDIGETFRGIRLTPPRHRGPAAGPLTERPFGAFLRSGLVYGLSPEGAVGAPDRTGSPGPTVIARREKQVASARTGMPGNGLRPASAAPPDDVHVIARVAARELPGQSS